MISSLRNQFRQSGFTLLEVMIALALTGFIVLIVTNALFFGLRLWESVNERQSTNELRFSGEYRLSKLLNAAQNRVIYTSGGETAIAFDGQTTEIIWIAPLRDVEGFDDPYWIRGYVATNEETGQPGLWISYFPYLPDQPIFETAINASEFDPEELRQGIERVKDYFSIGQIGRSELVTGVAGFEVQYLNIEAGSQTDFQASWQDEKSLPDLIQITLTNDDRESLRQINIRPRVKRHEL